jgi:hypothetical protein
MSEWKELLGQRFLSNRPSYARCLKRLPPDKREEFSREVYELLMQDIRRLEALLKEASVDASQFEVEAYTVNSWSKGNFQVKAHLKRSRKSWEPPTTQPSPVTTIKPAATRPFDVLCIPDIHFGFHGTTEVVDGEPVLRWKTIHDPKAVSIVLAVAAYAQPREIVILGDLLDLPGLGKYDTDAAVRQQTQSAFQAAAQFLRDLRTVCPATRIRLLEGNHELRLAKYLERNAPELGWAVNVSSLLGCVEHKIEYVGPYLQKAPIDEITWAYHGVLIGKRGGESAARMLAEHGEHNTIFGHTHRLEVGYSTKWMPDGTPRTRWSMGCGTLASLDGTVPGASYPDWQQGFGIIAGGVPSVIPIVEGRCTVAGKVFG